MSPPKPRPKTKTGGKGPSSSTNAKKKNGKHDSSSRAHGQARSSDTRSNSSNNNGSLLSVSEQQALLDGFTTAFPDLASPAANPTVLREQIQAVKAALYARDFASAFASSTHQKAYCLRWTPSRALAYAALLADLKPVLDLMCGHRCGGDSDQVKTNKNSTRKSKEEGDVNSETASDHHRFTILAIGAGAGAELVAFAALQRSLSRLKRHQDDIDNASQRLGPRLVAVDIADWTQVLEALADTFHVSQSENEQRGSIHNQKETEDYGGEAVLGQAVLSLSLSETLADAASAPNPNVTPLTTTSVQHKEDGEDEKAGQKAGMRYEFVNCDILSMDRDSLAALLEGTSQPSDQVAQSTTVHGQARSVRRQPALVTLFFTLNELYSSSRARTTALLLTLTALLPPGTLLLVVDSPGSYSTVGFGGSGTNASGSSNGVSGDQNHEGSNTDTANTTTTAAAATASSTATAKRDDQPKSQKTGEEQVRKYPMKWLLDHTLLETARAVAGFGSDSTTTATTAATATATAHATGNNNDDDDGQGQEHESAPHTNLAKETKTSTKPKSKPRPEDVDAAAWTKLAGEDARWWRLDRARLVYAVPGIGQLEDMRMQWHLYRRE